MEALSSFPLPPGFGFHPTDVELISHYLKGKILGRKPEFEVIAEVDIYKHEPWDLPAKCQTPTTDCKWHFFTSRDRKYPNGSRSNRATAAGYWKSTGKDRNVRFNNCIIGTKKTLVFHQGKPPYGKRTDWIMHEYYLNENECKKAPCKDIFVLCRVTKRNGLTREDEKVESKPLEDSIIQCASLPSINCPKELQDVSSHLSPKKEVWSPAENVGDLEAWFTELYDPNFSADSLTEHKSGDKVDVDSLDLKHVLHEKSFPPNHIEERDLSTPEEHGFYGALGHQFSDFEFDDNLFGLFNTGDGDAIYAHQLGPLSGVDYPSHPGYAVRCTKDGLLTESPTSSVELLADHHRRIPGDGEERISTPVPRTVGHQDTNVDTGIQIRRPHGSNSNEIPILQHRIRLQVHKMESRNPGPINQTFVFVSEDGHLNSTCDLDQDSMPRETMADPDLSRTFTNSRPMRAHFQEKPTYNIRSQGRIPENNNSGDPSSRSAYKLGSVCASMLSKLRCRMLIEPRDRSKICRRSHDSVRQACGYLRGICPLLRKCSLAGLNCLFLATCMMGTATLIAFFLARDARRFLGSSHIF